jgi:hypothetical protein
MVSDTTVEAAADNLDKNPRGLLLIRDELSGWVQSMNAYRGGKGSDRQFFLSVWSNSPITVDRKNQDEPLWVDRPVLGICGTIQPDVVQALLHDAQWDDGFGDRILFGYPVTMNPQEWTDTDVQDHIIEPVDDVFQILYGLDNAEEPEVVELTVEGKSLWVQWYNNHQAELMEAPDNLRGSWSKMPSQCARLILICHLLRWASEETPEKNAVDQGSVVAGTALAEYFKSHAQRVYDVLQEDTAGRLRRLAVDWIERKKNPGVSPRTLQQAKIPGIKDAKQSKTVLQDLVESERGRWEATDSDKAHNLFFLNESTPNTSY